MRRAGKSPPGCASQADPRRASSGPRSRTEPRSLPTSTGSGRSLVHRRAADAHRRRAGPSTVAPSPRISSSNTSTSRMRGTFDSTHSSSVSRHAASSGNAEFLLPSTATVPRAGGRLRFCPSFASARGSLRIRGTRFLRAAPRRTAPTLPHLQRSIKRANVARGGAPFIHDEVRVCAARHVPALHGRLSARRDRRARPLTTGCLRARGHAQDPDSGRCSPRSPTRAAAYASGRPAIRALWHEAPPVRRDETRKSADEHDLARAVQPAVVVAELHLGCVGTSDIAAAGRRQGRRAR